MNLYFSGSSSNIAFILKSSVCISSDELHKSCESLIKDFLCLKAMHNLSLFCGRSIKCNLFIISVNMSCVSAFCRYAEWIIRENQVILSVYSKLLRKQSELV